MVMTRILDQPTFSDSPFFFDRRQLSNPQKAINLVQVRESPAPESVASLTTTGPFEARCRVLPSEGSWKLSLWREGPRSLCCSATADNLAGTTSHETAQARIDKPVGAWLWTSQPYVNARPEKSDRRRALQLPQCRLH